MGQGAAPKARAKNNVQCKTTHTRRHILARRLPCHCDVYTVCMHKYVTIQFPQFDSFPARCGRCHLHFWSCYTMAAPTPFRPGNPAICGSRPLVTPYYCRLGDLLILCSWLLIVFLICLCRPTICSFSTLILMVGSFDLLKPSPI